ncbi:ArsR family transcriptional regulator [Geminocystis sp. NIES-3708]|nr:ArsR family transcriptional regulator [Geminocystis sp. NIES-3708]
MLEATQLGQANVSQHLKILAQVGIVTRNHKRINVYDQVANLFTFQLCD